MKDLQERTFVGCTAAKEAMADAEGNGWKNICKYASECEGVKDPSIFKEYCTEGGDYCISALKFMTGEDRR